MRLSCPSLKPIHGPLPDCCLAVLAVAMIGTCAVTALAVNKTWIGSGGGLFTTPGNWNPSGAPGQFDAAIFDMGNVSSPYIVWVTNGTFLNPIHVDIVSDRLIIAANPLSFTALAGSTLTVDSTNTTETARGLIIGRTGTGASTAVMNSSLASLSTVYGTLGVDALTSGTLNVNTGTFNVTGTAATYDLIIGRSGTGVVNINNGTDALISGDTALGKMRAQVAP
jgi:hypothetical protein